MLETITHNDEKVETLTEYNVTSRFSYLLAKKLGSEFVDEILTVREEFEKEIAEEYGLDYPDEGYDRDVIIKLIEEK